MSHEEQFIRGGLDSVFGEQVVDECPMPGVSAVDLGEVVLLVTYLEGRFEVASHVLGGITESIPLFRALGPMNAGLTVGSLYTAEGSDSENLNVVWSFKGLQSWLDPESRASAQMLFDVFSNAEQIVRSRRSTIQEQFGGAFGSTGESELATLALVTLTMI